MLDRTKAKPDINPNYPATSPAREALRTAIASRDRVAANVRRAEETLGRSRQLVAEVQNKLEPYRDLDAEVASDRQAAVRGWAETGHAKPDLSALPPRLAEHKLIRDAAREELATATAVCDALSRELATARDELRAAEAVVGVAVDKLMIERALLLIDELNQVRGRAFDLFDSIRAIASGIGGPSRVPSERLPFPRALVDIVNTPLDFRPELPGGRTYAGQRMPAVHQHMADLRSNPDAIM